MAGPDEESDGVRHDESDERDQAADGYRRRGAEGGEDYDDRPDPAGRYPEGVRFGVADGEGVEQSAVEE